MADHALHSPASFVERDFRRWKEKQSSPSVADLALRVRTVSGRSLASILLEFRRLAMGPGRLTPAEYVQYRVWEAPAEERSRFVSDHLHWPVVHAIGDRRYEAVAEDKYLAASQLQSAGIATLRCLGVVDRSPRDWPGIPVLRTGAELAALCRAALDSGDTVFGKPVFWLGGYGALLIDDMRDSRLHLASEGWIDAQAVVETCMGSWPYLLQICERPDPSLADLSERLPVVRLHAWIRPSAPQLHWPVLRAPTVGNLFTQTWLPGNLTYAIDIQTGSVIRAFSERSGDVVLHTVHPDSGVPLIGYVLPHWQEVLALADQTARVFAPLRYHSIEIGFAARGPVVVEVNAGSGFSTWQKASGQGVLTPAFSAFLDECGVRLEPVRWRGRTRRTRSGDDPFHWTTRPSSDPLGS